MYLFSLIKLGKIHTGSRRKIIPKEDFHTLVQANDVLALAHKEREELLELTRKECTELKNQAEAQGFQKGLELFNAQLMGLESSIKTSRHELQAQMLPLVLKASKRIVGEELTMNPDAIVNIIQQAIKPVTSHQQIKIYVNKNDLHKVAMHREALKQKFDKVEAFAIEERADISEGSCIIETEIGIINATLENQWRALEGAFDLYMRQQK